MNFINKSVMELQSKYFTLKEMLASETARTKGIDNTPTWVVVRNLNGLVVNLLDPIRELYGKPLYINSGYRCPKLNKAVGGVANSEHQYGYAADIDTRKGTAENIRLFNLIKASGLKFTQLIDEKRGQWVHVSYNASNLKCQAFKL